MLLQSEDVLTCPRRLLELYAAVTAGIPIVSLVCSGKGFDLAVAEDYLLHLDTSLPDANAFAVGILETNEAPVLRVAHALWTCLPNTITVPLNSLGSEHVIRAAVVDLIDAMQHAHATPAPAADASAWLNDREAQDSSALVEGVRTSSAFRGAQRGRLLKRVENAAEELHVARSELAASNEMVQQLMAKVKRLEAEKSNCDPV